MVRPSTSEQRPPLGSLEEQIKEAGRKVLHGTMSLILAASLVPTPPHYAFAESNGLSAQTSLEGSSGTDDGGGSGSAVATLDGDAGGGAGGTSGDAADDGNENAGGVEDGETGGNVLEGEAGTDADAPEEGSDNAGDSDEQPSEPEGSEEQADDVDDGSQNSIEGETTAGDASTGDGGSKSSGEKSSGGKSTGEKSAAEKSEGESSSDDTKSETPAKDDEKKDAEKQPEGSEQQEEEQVTLRVEASSPDGKHAKAGSGDNATTFYAKGTKVTFSFDESKLPEGASLRLDGAQVEGEGDAFAVERGKKDLTLTFNATGTYKEFSISGVQYTKDGTAKDATVEGASLESELHIDADAPASPKIMIGDVELNPDDLTPNDPRYINANGKTLSIEVEDVLFDAGASSVAVTSTTTDGFVATGANKYVATVENLSEGPLGIALTLADQLGNESSVYVGADESGTANDALIIDNTAPVLNIAEIGSKTLENGGLFNGKGVYLELNASDSSLDQNESKVTISKDGQEVSSTPWSQYGDDSSSYFPIDEEGTYTIAVSLVDKAGNLFGDNYTNVVVEQKAPEITTIVSNATETHQVLTDKTLVTAAPESGSAEVTVRVLDSGFASGAENDKTTNVKLVVSGTDKNGNPLQEQTIDDIAAWTFVPGTDGKEGVWEHSVQLPSEGTYDFHLEGASASDVPVDVHDVWTAEFDATAPVFQPLKVNGEDHTAGTVYARTGDNQSVTLDFKVTEEHFVPYSEAAPTGTKVTVTDAAGNDVTATTSEDAWGVDADGNHTYSVELTEDGTYTVVMTPGVDLVGNANTSEDAGVQRIPIEVDTEGPVIKGFAAKDGTYKGKVEEKDGDKITKLALSETENAESKPTVVVTLDEAHVGEKTGEITVTKKRGSGRAGGEDYTVSESWAGDGPTKTREITFNKEGSYTVTVKPGTDAVGNKGSDEPTEFVVDVDNTAPNATEESIVVNGEPGKGSLSNVYKRKEGAKKVTVTVTVEDENFKPYEGSEQENNGGTLVLVTGPDGTPLEYDAAAWTPVEGTDAWTYEVECSEQGDYKIELKLGEDQLGNTVPDAKVLREFTVDTVGPQTLGITLADYDDKTAMEGTDGESNTPKLVCRGAEAGGGKRKSVTATISMNEAHPVVPDANKPGSLSVAVQKTKTTFAKRGEEPVGYKLTWNSSHTEANIELLGEGTFTITAELNNDAMGNEPAGETRKLTQVVVVDNTGPVISGIDAIKYDRETAQQVPNPGTGTGTHLLCRGVGKPGAREGVEVEVTVDEVHPDDTQGPVAVVKVNGVARSDVSWEQVPGESVMKGKFTLEGEGTFKITATPSKDLLQNENNRAVSTTIEVDNTEPRLPTKDGQPDAIQIQGKASMQDADGHDMYTTAEKERNVTAAVTVNEPHRSKTADVAIVTVYAGANVGAPVASTEQCAIGDWGGSAPDWTKKITFKQDGTYTIQVVTGEDAVGNTGGAKQTKTIVVDTEPPSITGEFTGKELKVQGDDHGVHVGSNKKSLRYFSAPKDGVVKVKVSVKDAHFKEGDPGTHIVVTNGSGRELAPGASTYTAGEWQHDQNQHTITLEFPNGGTYKVTAVAGQDALGNPSDEKKSTCEFVVDNTDPRVSLSWDSSYQPKIYHDGGTKTAYYGQKAKIVAKIIDANLDESATKVNGVTLNKLIPNGVGTAVRDGITYRRGGNPVTGLSISMEYPDGRYEVPMVEAHDFATHVSVAQPLPDMVGCKQFVVDTLAPTTQLDWQEDSDKTPNGTALVETRGGAKKTAFYNHPVTAIATFKDANLNESATTVNAMPLSSIFNQGEQKTIGVVSYKREGNASSANGLRVSITYSEASDAAPTAAGVAPTAQAVDYVKLRSDKKVLLVADGPTQEEKRPYDQIIVDKTAPQVSLAWKDGVAPAQKGETQKGETVKGENPSKLIHYDAEVTAVTTIRELYLNESATTVNGIALTELFQNGANEVTRDGITYVRSGDAANESLTIEITYSEGQYPVPTVHAVDYATNSMDATSLIPGYAELVVDKTNPQALLEWKKNSNGGDPTIKGRTGTSPEQVAYYDKSVTAIATIKETYLNEDETRVNGFVLSELFPNGVSEATRNLVKYVRSGDAASEGGLKIEITYPGGEHTFAVPTVHVVDYAQRNGDAKNLLDGHSKLVVDTIAPRISTNYEDLSDFSSLAGDARNFFNHDIDVEVTIEDAYLDISTVVLTGPDGENDVLPSDSITWSQGEPDANGVVKYTAVVHIGEADGDRFTPSVVVSDFAKNTSTNAADVKHLVVDKTAPSISVSVDHEPVSSGSYGGDAVHFFNQATSLVFTVKDIHELRYASVDDPDGQYSIASAESIQEGVKEGTVVVALVDGTQSGNDTEYDRLIKFRITDVAGNWREWTLDRQGNVQDERTGTDHYDTEALGGTGVADDHPEKLIQDLTAPHVELAGVTPGTYYNTPQVVRATVNEFNFGYLQAFDANRSIVFITKYEGNYTRAESSSTIAASQFVGERPVHTHDEEFASDGHYVIRAQFKDFAENLSNLAEIGEFTIDRTPPVITVTWDNHNAENGNHYKASRTATITVTEHNFNPLDFQIVTGGIIGGWSTVGDTHTITVLYSADGTYTLSVSGKDKAGNQAIAYNEPPFIIDTTMPQVSFKGAVQRYGVDEKGRPTRSYKGDIADDGVSPEGVQGEKVDQPREEVLQDHHAYNGVVRPIIVFRDDNSADGTLNYNARGVSYTVTDGGGNDVTSKFQSTESRGGINGPGNGEEFSFGDLGLVVDDEGNPVVDQNASSEGDTRYVYRPEMDGIYTMHAVMTDLAGNKAANDITFSVNRYGSTYVVEVIDPETGESMDIEQGIDGLNYHIVPNSPRIEVTEVNVSGSESEDDHQVRKEYANVPASIKAMSDAEALREARKAKGARPAGYRLTSGKDSNEAKDFGWSEYHYTIREGNFGMGSDSDHEDRGQGEYRVNVYSVDRATNDVGTDNYLDTGAYGEGDTQASIDSARRNAQVSFTLDEIAPTIEDVKLPGLLHVGSSYEASFYVNDVITDGDEVTIEVDGRRLGEGDFRRVSEANDGTGEYRFAINTNFLPFSPHSVKISVSDSHSGYEGHKPVTYESKVPFFVSILVPEIALVALVVSGVTAGVVYFRRRKDAAEPEMPGSYE